MCISSDSATQFIRYLSVPRNIGGDSTLCVSLPSAPAPAPLVRYNSSNATIPAESFSLPMDDAVRLDLRPHPGFACFDLSHPSAQPSFVYPNNSAGTATLTPLDRFDAAIKARDISTIRQLLIDDLDPNALFNENLHLLHYAILSKQLDVVRTLLQAGADPNKTTVRNSLSPLMVAVQNSLPACLPILVDAGADPALRTAAGTPLEMAQRYDDLTSVEILRSYIDNGGGCPARAETSPLETFKAAVATNDLYAVKAVLDRGLDPNAKISNNMHLLHFVINERRLNMARELLKAGADPNLPTPKKEFTPIMTAIQYGAVDFIPELVAVGADPALRTAAGTALEIATMMRNPSAVSQLSAYGAKSSNAPAAVSNDPIEKFKTALSKGDVEGIKTILLEGLDANSYIGNNLCLLHQAIYEKQLDAARALFAANADPNRPTLRKKLTPIMVAIQYGMINFIPELVAAGADPALCTAAGTALEMAEKLRNLAAAETIKSLISSSSPGSSPIRPTSEDMVSQFASAVEVNDVNKVHQLLQKGFDPNMLVTRSAYALHHAISLGRVNIARELIGAGADPNLPTPKKQFTPLMVAAGRHCAAIIPELLAAGADPRKETIAGTALSIAEACENVEGVQELKRVLWTPIDRFKEAMELDDVSQVQGLLVRELKPDSQCDEDSYLIHYALKMDRLEIARKLLKAGADPNLPTPKKEFTPIMTAIQYGAVDFIPELVAAGADPALRTAAGTALEIAKQMNRQDIIQLLLPSSLDTYRRAVKTRNVIAVQDMLDTGFDPNSRYGKSLFVLHCAITGGALDIARLLLRAGADPNKPTIGDEYTPVMAAISKNREHFIPELVAAGADLTLRTAAGTALEIAEDYENDEAVSLIDEYLSEKPLQHFIHALEFNQPLHAALVLSKGLSPNTALGSWYLLHKSVAMDRLEIARKLLKAGADPNLPTPKKEFTPIMTAIQYGAVDFIPELVAAGADPALRTAAGTALEIAEKFDRTSCVSILS